MLQRNSKEIKSFASIKKDKSVIETLQETYKKRDGRTDRRTDILRIVQNLITNIMV